ncbi:MAG: hypothetical protein WDW38_001982 [Sanguina aurantia]
MGDTQQPPVEDAAAITDALVEDEDADLANASEWGDEDMGEDETMEEAAPVAAQTAAGSTPQAADSTASPSQQHQQPQQSQKQTKQQRRDKKKLKRPEAGTLGVEDDYDNEDADEDEGSESEEEETGDGQGLGGGSSSATAATADGGQQAGEAGGSSEQPSAGSDQSAPERTLGAHELWRQKVLGQLLDEQEDRFEHFRRSAFDKPKMKKILGALTSATFRDNVATALCGISKLYVGELVEAARVVATQESHDGALQPHHIRTAYQRLLLKAKGGVQKQALRGRLLR